MCQLEKNNHHHHLGLFILKCFGQLQYCLSCLLLKELKKLLEHVLHNNLPSALAPF